MAIKRVGFVGWRGMVGTVLMERMREENDFADITEAHFFTTSQSGQAGPDVGQGATVLKDARDIEALKAMDAIVTCQGGDYTKEVFGPLRDAGWDDGQILEVNQIIGYFNYVNRIAEGLGVQLEEAGDVDGA